MRHHSARLAAIAVLAVATALFTSVALADPGHGNSANAPGQQKQEQRQTAQPQTAQPTAEQPELQQSPGQAKHEQQAAASSSQAGVKPSSTTKHWQTTTVGASPDVSKRYGNGQTAAQIAKGRGAPDSQPLVGPGNSQPHKTYDCRHKNNKSGGVDVHAIKSYSSTACATSAPTTAPVQPTEHKVTLCHATGSATNPYVMITVDYHALQNGHTAAKGDIIPPTTINGVTYSGNWDAAGQAIFNNGCQAVAAQAPAITTAAAVQPTVPTTNTVTVTTTTQQATTQTVTVGAVQSTTVTVTTTAAASAPVTTNSGGSVLGAQTHLARPKSNNSGGVLGTVGNVPGGTLPFTGFPLWLAVLVAFALILAGIAVRRRTLGARL